MMFVRLKDLHNQFVVCDAGEIECIFVGKIDRKGNTATIVQFKDGDYCCVSESVSDVAECIGSPMFLKLKFEDKSIVFNIEAIERVFVNHYRKAKGRTTIKCKSGNCYFVSDYVWDISTLLLPRKPKTDN